MLRMHTKTIAYVSAALVTAIPIVVRAAPATSSTGQAQPPVQLQEVTVTATRRKAPEERVPISLSVLTGANLANGHIDNIASIAAATPGLQFSTPVAPSTITTVNIRGINTNTGPATVGIYLNDTPLQTRLSPLGNIGGPLPIVSDLNRVEVERGPQGTLFGAGSEAGAVRFITNEPDLSLYSGDTDEQYSTTKGGQSSYKLSAAAGGPIVTNTLGFRISALDRRNGGYVNLVNPLPGPSPHNAITERNVNRNYQEAFRAALAYKTGFVRITPAIYYQRVTRDDSGKFYPAYSNVSAGSYNDAVFLPEHSIDSWTLPSLTVEAALQDVNIKFISSYLHRDVTVTNDFGDCFVCFGGSGYGSPLGGDVPISTTDAAPSVTGQRNKAYTEELRLSSSNPADKVTWVAGLFYDNRTQNDYQKSTQLSTNSSGAPVFVVNQTYRDIQTALYGNVDFHFAEKWIATLGLRLAHDSTTFSAITGGAAPGTSPTVFFSPQVGASLSQNPVTPRAVISYQVDPDSMFYFSVAKGYRVGGGNAPLPSGCTGNGYRRGYGSDSIWSYEIGSKNMLLNNRLQLNGSVYHMVWSNIQQLLSASCGISYVGNTGTAVSNGFDLSVHALLTPRLRISAKVNYTNAYYADSVFSGPSPVVLQGEKVGFLPQVISPWNVNVVANYDIPVGGNKVVHIRAEDQYNSHNPGPFQNQIPSGLNYVPLLRANPATNLVDASVGLTVGNADISAFVNNVFNSQPLIGALSYLPMSTTYRLAYSTFRPRTIGVNVNYSFGNGY